MRLEEVRLVLVDLAATAGVRAAIFSARDGLLLAAAGDAIERGGTELRAALAAAAFATVDRAISQFAIGSAETIRIETASHTMLVAEHGAYLLVVIAERRANPTEVRWEMRQAARRLVGIVPGLRVRHVGNGQPSGQVTGESDGQARGPQPRPRTSL